jgi:hypothetical protein
MEKTVGEENCSIICDNIKWLEKLKKKIVRLISVLPIFEIGASQKVLNSKTLVPVPT